MSFIKIDVLYNQTILIIYTQSVYFYLLLLIFIYNHILLLNIFSYLLMYSNNIYSVSISTKLSSITSWNVL